MQYPSWSFSTYNTFRGCKRQYFFDKYNEVCKNRFHIIALKKMTSLPMMSGGIVHNIISSSISERFRLGKAPTGEQMEKVFRMRFAEEIKKSVSAVNQSKYSYMADCMLEEHYYNIPDTEEKIKQTEEKCAQGLIKLSENNVWDSIINKLKPENIRYIEDGGFPSFMFGDIKVYAIIDFAAYNKQGNWYRIFDWKTGKAGSADRLQLAVYGLYALREWGWRPENVKFQFVHLTPEIEKVNEQLEAEDIERAAETIRTSFNEMLTLYNNEEPKIDNFPKSESGKCRFCRYRELCALDEREIIG